MLFLGSVLNARLSFAVENLSCGPVKGSNTNQDVAYLADKVWACMIWISCLSSLNLVFSLTNYLPSVLPWKCFCPACKALNSYLSCFILDCTHFSWQCGQLCMKAGCYMGTPPPSAHPQHPSTVTLLGVYAARWPLLWAGTGMSGSKLTGRQFEMLT